MHKTTFFKMCLFTLVFLQVGMAYSQNLKPFKPRFDKDLKGDMLLIGNSILNRATQYKHPNDPYNATGYNSDFFMDFVNIDYTTPGIFSSSSANLKVPNSQQGCYKIVYAALYWGAVTKGTTPITDIKFKMPSGAYHDVVGEVIHSSTAVVGTSYPYACYADVTSLVTGASNANPEGTYTVANMSSAFGTNGGTGLSAGWSLFIVYEDPKLPSKAITSFDGFSAIDQNNNLDITVSGFRTIPTGPVRAKFAFAALEGDLGISGDYLMINNNNINAYDATNGELRPYTNFFNSSVTHVDPVTLKTANFLDRNPASTNTLGYDSGVFEISNPLKPDGTGYQVIANNTTSAKIKLGSTGDVYFYYFNALALEIIEPKIILTKEVYNIPTNGTPPKEIGNTNVNLADELYYHVGFQNIGNDAADNFIITDVLPINVIFDPANIILPDSRIKYTYTAPTRTVVFTIPKDMVKINDPKYVIKFKVKVVENCNDLSDACSNIIQNQAYASYKGVTSGIQVNEQPSLPIAGTCSLGNPSSTNFLVGINDCKYTKEYQLCGADVVLTAANGYNTYSWSKSPTGSPVIGTTQSITVTEVGTYYVKNTAVDPCISINQTITVKPIGTILDNPVKPFADAYVKCPNNPNYLPKIFLCGAKATREIRSGITDAESIVWQKLNEASCPAVGLDDCANENSSCTWTDVETGTNYTANTTGQYRLRINYPNGCFNIYYFNVYKNLLNPTVKSTDIICTTQGQIAIEGVPTGYQYSLNAAGSFQDSNVFTVTTAGVYTAYIKQIGTVSNPCIFEVPNINILSRDFSVSEFVTQPLCSQDKGIIKLAANDVRPGYYYTLKKGATTIGSVGSVTESDYTFSNLDSGTYTYEVKTADQCIKTGTIEIKTPAVLNATATQNKPITCEPGEIKVTVVGGTPPFSLYINGATTPQSNLEIEVTTPATYTIKIVDYNSCVTNATVTVGALPAPVYTVSRTDLKCYGDVGSIEFKPTNANGYALEYSIDNGVTYQTNPLFSSVAAGTHIPVVKYTLTATDGSSSICTKTEPSLTLASPDSALTASVGVSELAGCGTNGEGKIRITNPQGGTPPYTYSFDGATYGSVNEKYLTSGTYTVYIKDQTGCVFPMNVIIDAQPLAPTIEVVNSAFNCDGSATSTVTVTSSGGSNFVYEYLIDGNPNPNTANPKVFLNVPVGSHVISVNYKMLSVSTYSNLLFEDFGSGPDVKSPGINPAFCWQKQDFTTCNTTGKLDNGQYTVTNRLKNNPYSGWHNPVDHTSGSATGRYLVVDAGTAIPNNAVLYRKTINDIIPNQPIQVRFFATNLLKVGNTQPDASLTVELQNTAGVSLSSQSTGGIPKTNGWVEYQRTINPGNNTTLDFILRLEVAQENGIDFAVDDIQVYQLPVSCATKKDFPIIVPADKVFKAAVTGSKNVTCSGLSNGAITIAAENFNTTTGYQYSIDGGSTWSTQMTSPYTITGLTATNYAIQIRYDAAATGSCVFPFTQIITAPDAFVVEAMATVAKCTPVGATVTATATGGTPGYTYQLIDKNAPFATTTFPANGILVGVLPGTYTVTGKDANGCTDDKDTDLTIAAPVAPTASLATTSNLCYTVATGATLVVTVTGGVAPYTYKLDTNAAVTTNTFTNVGIGAHTILVTDANGCTAPVLSQTINGQVVATALETKTLDCSTSPEAVISGSITNGTAPYVVTLLSGTGPGTLTQPTATGTTFAYTSAVAGTNYSFEIKDANGCTTTASAIIKPLSNPTASATSLSPQCHNGTDGEIKITVAGGSGGYLYSFNGSATFTAQSHYTGLTAYVGAANTKDFTYQIKDSKGCLSPIYTITLTNPTKVAATASIVPITNCSTTTTLTATATGGTAPYTYSFKNGVFTPTNTYPVNDNGTDQTIAYSVKDAKGCVTLSQDISVKKLNKPTLATITSTPIYCAPLASTTSTATVTTTAGTGVAPFVYTITGPTTNTTGATTGIFTGLTAGTYIFTVTDANGCTDSKSHPIANVNTIKVTPKKILDVLCHGDATGKAQYTVTGFSSTGNYTVTVTPSVAAANIATVGDVVTLSNLTSGTYNVAVQDKTTGCTASANVVIMQPTAPLALASTSNVNANCFIATAKLTVNATGGTRGYTYAFTPTGVPPVTTDYTIANSKNLNPTVSLTWDAWVKDANGCTTSIPITIAIDPQPVVTTTISDQCTATGNNYQIVASGTGGMAPYTYTINTGIAPSPANTFTVAPGAYTITIKDANGCTGTTPVVVAEVLHATAALTKDLTCTLPTDATIAVVVTGGKAPFEYKVNVSGAGFGTSIPFAGTPLNYTATASGTYQFEIKDANGCTILTNTVPISAIVNPEITLLTESQTIKCNGDTTGAITVAIDASKGVGPFTYSIDGVTYQPSNVFTGLATGIYTVTVKDSKGCTNTTTKTITLAQPMAMTIIKTVTPIQCISGTGTSKGAIVIEKITDGVSTLGGSGGTPGYTYYVTGINGYNKSEVNPTGNVSTTFSVVDFGLYQIRVVDANGCSVMENDVLVASPVSSLTIDINATADCLAGGTATVKITSSYASSGPFHFNIYNGTSQIWTADGTDGWKPETTTESKESIFTGLKPGITYTFIVYDENTKCYYYEIAKVPVPSTTNLLVNAIVPKNSTCTGSNNGNVSFNIQNNSGSAINYEYEIFEAFTNDFKYKSGTFSVAASSTNSIVTIPFPLPKGSYYVYVKETSGPNKECGIASDNFTIKESPVLLSVKAKVVNNENCTKPGTISAEAKDGTAPYSFMMSTTATLPLETDPSWDPKATFEAAAGNYYVFVKDAYGCIQSSTGVTIAKDPEPSIALAVVAPCAVEGNFEISVTLPTEGIAPYTITVNNGAPQNALVFPYTVTNLNSGIQTIEITDVNGCKSTQTVTLHKKLSVTAVPTKELDCTIPGNGIITLNVTDGLFTTDGINDFTYEVAINGTPSGTAVPFGIDTRTTTYTLTTAGTYKFTIKDVSGCQVESSIITMDPIVNPTATSVGINPSCPTQTDGTITITASLGVTPYEYSTDAGATWQAANTFTGLAAGTYNYSVRDAKQCVFNGSQILTDPAALTATAVVTNFACNATNNPEEARVTINPTGGTAPYTYNFDGSTSYSSSNIFIVANQAGETVNYAVKDVNGCTTTGSIAVAAYKTITDLTFAGTAPTCAVPTSDVVVTVVGGYSPMKKFEIVLPTAIDNGTSNTFNGLTPGTYLFKVTDANGCSFEKAYTVIPVTPIAVEAVLLSDITCNAANGSNTTGTAVFTITGFSATGNYDVVYNPTVPAGTSSSTNDVITLTNLTAGTYTATITDRTTGCSITGTVILKEPNPITFTAAATKVFCSQKESEITISAVTGGTGLYSYAVVPTAAPAPSDADYGSNPTLYVATALNLANLSWDVYVKDTNGCVAGPVTTVVTMNALPTIAPPALDCYIGSPLTTNLDLAATSYNSVRTYFINGTPILGNIATFNGPGTYVLGVKDDNGCEAEVTYTIEKQLLATATITKELFCIAPIAATITVIITNGVAPYSYQMYKDGNAIGGLISLPPTATSFAVNVTDTGRYYFGITDSNAAICLSKTNEIDINVPINPTFTTTKVAVTCNGGTDGSITAVLVPAANEDPVYSYQIIAPALGVAQPTGTFTNLVAGSYTIEVTSGKGCKATQTITVDEPALITVPAPVVIPFGCTTGTNTIKYATITVNAVTGGSGTYTIYEFFKNGNPIAIQRGLSNTYTEADHAGGTYTVNVYDNKNCIGTTTTTIAPYVALDKVKVLVTVPVTCANTETITATALDTAGNAITTSTYELKDAAGLLPVQSNTTGIFTGLTIGNYTITATNTATGCSIQAVHYVNNPNTFELKAVKTNDVTCFGSTEGSVELTFIDRELNPTNDAGPFTYTVTGPTASTGTAPSAGPYTIGGLKAGVYFVTATLSNSPQCAVTTSFSINQPDAKLTATTTHTKITCVAGNNDGTISVAATGGWPGAYQFELVGPTAAQNVAYGTQNNFVNLIAGTYTINVKDSKGCIETLSVTLVNPTPIAFTATPSTSLVSCFGDATATLTVGVPTGGSGSYLYTLLATLADGRVTTNGPQTANVFTNLGAASYQVQVTDSWNCSTTASTPIVIAQPTKVVASLTTAKGITCTTNATLTLSATGGTGPYTYSDTESFTTSLGSFATQVTFSVPVGTYHYYVKDANGCISYLSNDIKIEPLEPLLPNLDVVSAVVNCKGDATGVIVANASGGLGNYVYTLLDGSGNAIVPAPAQTTLGRFDKLPAGFYQVRVQSGDCQTVSAVREIKEPSTNLTFSHNITNIKCFGEKNGEIEIIGSGGTGEIKYAISPLLNQFFDKGVFKKLEAGPYQVVIQDQNGCFILYDFVISEPLKLQSALAPGSILEEICSGDTNGAFGIDIVGGTAPYSVSLDDINGTYTTGTATQTYFDFKDLKGGDHYVFIRDAQGCITDVRAALQPAVNMSPIAIMNYSCVINANSNQLTVKVSSSITNLTDIEYALDGGAYQSSNVFKDLTPGSHVVKTRHTNGCEQETKPFEVEAVQPLTLILKDGELNEIVAVAAGGGGQYTYLLNGQEYGSTANFVIYKSGNYIVTVIDGNGCNASVSKYYTFIDVCIPNNFTPNGDGVNDTWGPGCTNNYKNMVYTIFDRYGRELGNYRLGQYWDGKYKGAELPSGDYWYVIKLNDPKENREFVGHFTLYR